MTALLRGPLCDYNGPLTSSFRWRYYIPREGDIIISAPPKSGTTWTQTLVLKLLLDCADLPISISNYSPWLDANFSPIENVIAQIEKQTARRCLKTHTPLDGIPIYAGVYYTTVFRHPLDALVSAASQALRVMGEPDAATASARTTIEHYMQAGIRSAWIKGNADRLSVRTITHHVREAWLLQKTANVYLLHYSDLWHDPLVALSDFCSFLHLNVNCDAIKSVLCSSNLDKMKSDPCNYVPSPVTQWEKPELFFGCGGVNSWYDYASSDLIFEYRNLMQAELPSG